MKHVVDSKVLDCPGGVVGKSPNLSANQHTNYKFGLEMFARILSALFSQSKFSFVVAVVHALNAHFSMFRFLFFLRRPEYCA